MIIYLIGMPGSGKTTIGKALAKEMDFDYIDIDTVIEKKMGMYVEEIFKKYGEAKFRDLETETLKSISKENAIVSCGGGIVIDQKNKQLMKGIKFYLDTDIKVITKRLESQVSRPLLKEKTLKQLYDERFFCYQDFADAVISNNYDIETTIRVIKNYIKTRG